MQIRTLNLALALTLIANCPALTHAADANLPRAVVVPQELSDAVLHNPDMGWVLYENYPLDQEPAGSSTLLLLPKENFDDVDAVAIMFSWQDIEKRADEYDWSKVDYAYDYWASRGKEIQLRLSATTLLWWANRTPPAGKGVPDYVLERMAPDEKQSRELQGIGYVVEDARAPYYRQRLTKFLQAVDAHFSETRPVTLIDLRGFGVWGEWHSGFKYATDDERHAALSGIIDLWSEALPNHRLALSYSYDPDGPKKLYEGPTDKFDERSTKHYREYLRYSAFDHALTKSNVTFRRDGCGGAVHSNERKLNDEAFRLGRGPMFSEFLDGYGSSKKGGDKWVEWKIDDALSLHPNYICLLGYQGADTLAFIGERRDLFDKGLRQMGYRLVPTRFDYPITIAPGQSFELKMEWVNRGVGRALRDYELQLVFVDSGGGIAGTSASNSLRTSDWVAGQNYSVKVDSTFDNVASGEYQLGLQLRDPKTNRLIQMPLAELAPSKAYTIGPVTVANRPSKNEVKQF